MSFIPPPIVEEPGQRQTQVLVRMLEDEAPDFPGEKAIPLDFVGYHVSFDVLPISIGENFINVDALQIAHGARSADMVAAPYVVSEGSAQRDKGTQFDVVSYRPRRDDHNGTSHEQTNQLQTFLSLKYSIDQPENRYNRT